MSIAQSLGHIEYPESDGEPMGETDLHRDWMVRILDMLRYRYREQSVYVASNLLVYYEEGVLRRFVVPDNFVVLGCDPKRRRVFKTWEEEKVPDVVFEVTSRSTKQDDESFKPQIYERIGVKEYFLYDPTNDYLQPSLQGHRLHGDDGFVAITANEDGGLACEALGILLRLDDQDLVISDAATGDVLLTEAESERAAHAAERAAREAERAAREAERAARDAAEARAADLQAELDRLRGELRRREDDAK